MPGYHVHRIKFDISEGPVRLHTDDSEEEVGLVLELQREDDQTVQIQLDLCAYSALRSVLDMTDNWWEAVQAMLRTQAHDGTLRRLFGQDHGPDDDDEGQMLWQGHSPN